jgi:hypothetical protein
VDRFAANGGSNGLGALAQLLFPRAWQGDKELLATVTTYEVVGADVLAEAAGGFFEHHVADEVAKGVIYLLEIVEIEQQEPDAAFDSDGALQFAPEEIEEGTAVPEPGKAITHGLVAEFFAGMDEFVLQGQDAVGNEEAGAQFRLAEWLSEAIVGTGLQGMDDVTFIGARGDHEDVVVVGTGPVAEAAAELDAINTRHGPIDDHDLWRLFLFEHLPGIDAVVDDDDFVTPTQNPMLQNEPGDRVILSNQYARKIAAIRA